MCHLYRYIHPLINRSPEIIVDFFMKTFENNPELNETVGILKKILAVTDVVMDQALRVLQGMYSYIDVDHDY